MSADNPWYQILNRFYYFMHKRLKTTPLSDPGPPGVRDQIRIAYPVLSDMKTLPYQFGWATITGFRDHSRLTRLHTTEINA